MTTLERLEAGQVATRRVGGFTYRAYRDGVAAQDGTFRPWVLERWTDDGVLDAGWRFWGYRDLEARISIWAGPMSAWAWV